MRPIAFAFGLALIPFTAFVGCSDEGSDDTTSGSPSGNGAGASSASSTGPGPGSGGAGAQGGTGTTGGTGSGGEQTGGSGTGGATAGDHLLISELASAPETGEFIEIHNPTSAAVDLSDYYLCDNSTYHEITSGQPFAPITDNVGSDFLARFPAGTTIPAGGFIVIATHEDFEITYADCPDFVLSETALTCTQGMAPAMELIPDAANTVLAPGTLFSNSREMVILFRWDGSAAAVEDVDYLTWGAEFEAGTRVDKTGVAGYQPDTVPAMQKGAPAPAAGESIERCPQAVENGEKTTGGNGIDGHDETSEALDTSFKLQVVPTPTAANGCN